jgi:hypothetical protein
MASHAAEDQGVNGGRLRFMWADAVASFMFDAFAAERVN